MGTLLMIVVTLFISFLGAMTAKIFDDKGVSWVYTYLCGAITIKVLDIVGNLIIKVMK